jgi:predicted thioesterase
MKQIFKPGDIKVYKTTVNREDVAIFQGELVHDVCSTFALARDIEWTTRQFVLEMKEEDEEGIGTYLQIAHKAPAFVGEELIVTGTFESLTGHELSCSYKVFVGSRLIAEGTTGQKILKREKINILFNHG